MRFKKRGTPFAELLDRSVKHRKQHRCGAYPYKEGSLLRVIAAGLAPNKIIEVGTAVGYTAICMLDAAPAATIDTVDFDEEHVALANRHFQEFGKSDRATAHFGNADDVLVTLNEGAYDLGFFDGFEPTQSILKKMHALLRPGGFFVCANLTLGGDGHKFLDSNESWITHSFGETAFAVKR